MNTTYNFTYCPSISQINANCFTLLRGIGVAFPRWRVYESYVCPLSVRVRVYTWHVSAQAQYKKFNHRSLPIPRELLIKHAIFLNF